MPSKTEAIARLRRQITQLGAIPESRSDRSGAFDRWHRAARVAVDYTFGDDSKHSREFAAVTFWPYMVTQSTPNEDRQRSYSDGLKRAAMLLEAFIEEVEEYWPSDRPAEDDATERDYDVCLSFAGEDRPYVEAVAESLRRHGIRSFYDFYEEVSLWGKDLYQHLDEVYRNRAQFCVLFISDAYARKLWTKHELRSAQARAFEEHQEYILPARFDSTELPGVPPTIAYVDLQQKKPAEFAELIVQKIRSTSERRRPRHRPGRIEVTAGVSQRPLATERRPHIMPIRPWFTNVSVSERGTLQEEPAGPLGALVAPFRNDPTPEHPYVVPASRLSATVWLEAIPNYRASGYWLHSTSPHISLAAGEQWLLVVAVVAPKLASLVVDGRRGDAGLVELKHFWTAPTDFEETVAVVSVVNDGILLGQYRYNLKITPPFANITLLSE